MAGGILMAEITGYGNTSNSIYLKSASNVSKTPNASPSPLPDINPGSAQKDVEIVLSFEQSRMVDGTYQELERRQQRSYVGELTAVEQRALDDLRFEQKNRAAEEPSAADLEESSRRSIDILI